MTPSVGLFTFFGEGGLLWDEMLQGSRDVMTVLRLLLCLDHEQQVNLLQLQLSPKTNLAAGY